jgi:DNA-binding MarR family transcriptional regulator
LPSRKRPRRNLRYSRKSARPTGADDAAPNLAVEPVAFDESGRPNENREITLNRRDLRDAIRLLRRLVEADDQSLQIEPTDRPIADRQTLIKRARRVIAERNKRIEVFGKAMFREPAWDMLLILYVEQNRLRFTIGRLADAAGASATTALRWLEYLESQGMIRRYANPTDRRSFFVGIADRGLQALDLYFSEILMPMT